MRSDACTKAFASGTNDRAVIEGGRRQVVDGMPPGVCRNVRVDVIADYADDQLDIRNLAVNVRTTR